MIHLHVRSAYSLLNGLMSVEDIVENAKRESMSAVALTDFQVLHGALEFQQRCDKAKIKPLFGLELIIDGYTSTVLAKNNQGYQALMQLSYKATQDESLSMDDILVYQSNLILCVHSENGPFESSLLNNQLERVTEILHTLRTQWDHVYIGLSHQESAYLKASNETLIELAQFEDIQTFALSKIYYEKKTDDVALRIVQAVGKGTYLEDKTLVSSPNRHFLSQDEMSKLYTPEQLALTETVAKLCQVDLNKLTTELPIFPTGQEVDNTVYLSQLSNFGLQRRLNGMVNSKYKQRLEYELSVINSMHYTDYFLIVYDVIRFAKKEGIYVGPGRGSAAGSLVSYALGITEIDPIAYDLLFERFLNPERISMPDIDIDFPDNRRQDVIDYVRQKYGDDHVSHIVTFGTMKARQAFRDVARVLQVPVRKVDQVTKLITAATLQENYDNVPKFRTQINGEKQLQETFKHALSIEGLMRHRSVHAGGIVLSRQSLLDVVPIIQMDSNSHATQYDMTRIESIGLTKIDFLGLRNLSIIDAITKRVGVNIMKIPLDDMKTFDLLDRGETIGLFQVESEGMTQLLKKMHPKRFMDIVDTIALYRPGPMENIPLYLKSRANPNAVTYLHPDIEAITKSTYGVLVYQEQIMQVAQKMAGFTLGRADILRKAMGKKNAKELASLKDAFIDGCIENGYTSELSHSIFELIEKFANYGFNKSHSVAYGLVAYQMAYLKAHYPLDFYSDLLTSVLGSDVKTRQYIDECRRRHILLMGPHISNSGQGYTLETNGIRMPLTIIKGITTRIAILIQTEVENNGAFKSYYDAISRLNIVGIKNAQFEALIRGGAFDAFEHSRQGMIASLDEAIRYANIIKVKKDDGFILNYDLISEPLFTEVRANVREDLQYESDLLGFYHTQHPASALKRKHSTDSLSSVGVRSQAFRIIAMIESVKLHKTKNGQPMAFVSLSDDTGTQDSVVFPDSFEKYNQFLQTGNIVLVKASMRKEGSLIVEDIHLFET